MAKMKLEQPSEDETIVELDQAVAADLVPTESTALTSLANVKLGEVEGDVEAREVQIPRLSIVQSVGPMSEKFSPGEIVLNKQLVIASGDEKAKEGTPKSVEFVIAAARKFYEENIPFEQQQAGARPRVWQAHTDVVACGLHTEWKEDPVTKKGIAPPVNEVLELLLFIACPPGVDDAMFPVCIGDRMYAIGLWSLRGVAYRRCAKVIYGAKKYQLRDSLLAGSWQLNVVREKVMGGNLVWVPYIKIVGNRNSPEVQGAFKAALGQ